jgi:hypothetical protein
MTIKTNITDTIPIAIETDVIPTLIFQNQFHLIRILTHTLM